MRYIVTHRVTAFDVCSATLGYHVLCRRKHADLFEADWPRQRGSALSGGHARMCGEDAGLLLLA